MIGIYLLPRVYHTTATFGLGQTFQSTADSDLNANYHNGTELLYSINKLPSPKLFFSASLHEVSKLTIKTFSFSLSVLL